MDPLSKRKLENEKHTNNVKKNQDVFCQLTSAFSSRKSF